jgi:hypothetical protein
MVVKFFETSGLAGQLSSAAPEIKARHLSTTRNLYPFLTLLILLKLFNARTWLSLHTGVTNNMRITCAPNEHLHAVRLVTSVLPWTFENIGCVLELFFSICIWLRKSDVSSFHTMIEYCRHVRLRSLSSFSRTSGKRLYARAGLSLAQMVCG